MYSIKYLKYFPFLLFLFLLGVSYFFDIEKRISTNLTAILPEGEGKKLLNEMGRFRQSHDLYIVLHRNDEDAFQKIINIEEKLLKSGLLSLKSNPMENEVLLSFIENYKVFIFGLKEKPNKEQISQILQNARNNIMLNPFMMTVDKEDPLNLFSSKSPIFERFSFQNGHLYLKDYGYFSIFTPVDKTDSFLHFEKIYDFVHEELETFPELNHFSSIYYFVENSRIIKKQVNLLILISFSILIILYIFIIKNIKLLINTILVLLSSMLIAVLFLTIFFEEVSVFSLVFGLSISTVAIDYMFHHYLHGYYSESKGFNKSVFFGFLTTVFAFFLLIFVDFPLIKQIALLATISLFTSYILFSFLFTRIEFESKEKPNISFRTISVSISPIWIIIISLMIIFGSYFWIRFDSDIRKLDYQNHKLQKAEEFFLENTGRKNTEILLIKGNSIEELLQNIENITVNSERSFVPLSMVFSKRKFENKKRQLESLGFYSLNQEIQKIAKDVGFREGYFKDTYNWKDLKYPELSEKMIQDMGYDIIEKNGEYFTYGFIDIQDKSKFSQDSSFISLSLKEMFIKELSKVKNEIVALGTIALVFIIFSVYYSTKEKFPYSITYLLFPLSMILLYGYYSEFNILNIFMIFTILAICIDYGIYMANEEKDQNTKLSILYSLISTFAGFGVLVFSQINALRSIGITSMIGILAITFLLIFQKGYKK